MHTHDERSTLADAPAAVVEGEALPRSPLAPWWHTALLLLQLAALAVIGPHSARSRSTEAHLLLYTAGIMSQWLQLSAAVAGVYRRRAFFIDTLQLGKGTWLSEGVRGVFLFVAMLPVFALFAGMMRGMRHAPGFDRSIISAMAPANAAELVLWLLLSVVVAFCEEHVFRGYLLRQMTAWAAGAGASRSVASTSAVLLSSVLFGSLHLYEGVGGAILIGLLGAIYAVVALRRGNLRAVIVAHALQDFVAMLFVMMRRAHVAH